MDWVCGFVLKNHGVWSFFGFTLSVVCPFRSLCGLAILDVLFMLETYLIAPLWSYCIDDEIMKSSALCPASTTVSE